MNAVVSDWQKWRERWSSPEAADLDPSELRSDIASALEREQRLIQATKLKLGIVSGVALLAVAGALLHEARAQDLVFATILVVSVIVVAVLELESRRIPVDVSSKPTQLFVELSTNRLRRELRMARLILLPVLAELGFFLQWWIGGVRIHEHEPFAPVVIFTGWLPLVGMLAVLLWIVRMNARVRSELKGLNALRESEGSE
jgi:uncharacterized membrane protein SirB2